MNDDYPLMLVTAFAVKNLDAFRQAISEHPIELQLETLRWISSTMHRYADGKEKYDFYVKVGLNENSMFKEILEKMKNDFEKIKNEEAEKKWLDVLSGDPAHHPLPGLKSRLHAK
ncbi:hypothetical protein [Corticibacter populi]|uniref:hypothetical protein n=1 Tax=Corticibacter populi TaxID=1550736 RepID=UPI00102C1116|nr:hypothetical protein [Corticibacter populi]RZS35498.1 hypothetical protein EV687_0566 [Corticibacter populi]